MSDPKSLVQNKPANTGILISIIVSLVLAIIVSITVSYLFTPRIAYVETGRLMVGFSEAAQVEKEIKAEQEKYQMQLKCRIPRLTGV
jgi:Skp family chaperone for outer membrane proteins